MTQTEQIDTKAAKIAGTLANKLLTPFEDTLAQFEGTFPGITERLKSVVDLEKIKTAFAAEVGKSIKSLKEKGTEESLIAAIAKVKELRDLVEGSSAPSFAIRIDDSTFAFKVLGDPKLSQKSHIKAKLGADASHLIDDLESIGVQLDKVTVPEHSKAVLSRASTIKTYAEQKGFYADGLASPYEAVNIAMEAVCAAKQVGINLRTFDSESWEAKGARVENEALAKGLDEGTVAVLRMLTEGLIRFDNGSRSGALHVHDHGRLHASCDYGRSDPSGWAFGASPFAEKNNLIVDARILGINGS